MSEVVLCPNCGKPVGVRSLIEEKIQTLKIKIANTEHPTIDLSKVKPTKFFGFCPWCNYPINLREVTKKDE
jgi:hypothetical protein